MRANVIRPDGSRRSRKEVERMTRISEIIRMVITRQNFEGERSI